MKKILLLTFLFLTYFVNGQTIYTNKMPEYRFNGKLSVGVSGNTANPTDALFVIGDSATTGGFIIPRVQTTGAITTPRQGMLVYSISDSTVYVRDPNSWVALLRGGNSEKVDTIYVRSDSLFFKRDGGEIYGEVDLNQYITITNQYDGNKLVKGGVVSWSGTGYKYYVSPATYIINNLVYTSARDSVTFNASDPTLNRFDKIVLSTAGIVKLTGIAATNPAHPQVQPDSLDIFTILIEAGETDPGTIGTGISAVYNENLGQPTEWDGTVSGGATIDPASINFSTSGTKSIFFNGALSSAYIYFDLTTPIVHAGIDVLTFKIKPTDFTRGLQIFMTTRTPTNTFYVNSTSVILKNGRYGFDQANTDWQYISIPKSDFKLTTDSVKTIFFLNLATQSYYIDEINFQEGVQQPPVDGTRILLTAGNLSPLFTTSVTNTATSSTINFSAISQSPYTVYGRGSGSGVPSFLSLDTTFISAFSTKVRPLLSAGTGISYDNTTGVITNSSPGTSYTFSNGLTESPAGTVKLGGALIENTTLTGGAFGLILTGTSATVSSLDIANNSIGAGSIVNISSTSTAAASNLQKGLNVSLSGANATASQTTYGLYVSNTHSGTTPVNHGVYSTLTNGAGESAAFKAAVTTQLGLDVVGTSGTGVQSTVTTGRAILGQATGSNAAIRSVVGNATTTSNIAVLDMMAYSSGSAANGFSGSIDMYLEASDNSNPNGFSIRGRVTDVTAATFTTAVDVYVQKSNTITKTFTIAGQGWLQLNPITATAASAITASEGMVVFVSDTNATFTSIGFWGYQNGAWAKM